MTENSLDYLQIVLDLFHTLWRQPVLGFTDRK
jgi:hypothetical protein